MSRLGVAAATHQWFPLVGGAGSETVAKRVLTRLEVALVGLAAAGATDDPLWAPTLCLTARTVASLGESLSEGPTSRQLVSHTLADIACAGLQVVTTRRGKARVTVVGQHSTMTRLRVLLAT